MLLLLPYPTQPNPVALERRTGDDRERLMRRSANSEVRLCTRMVWSVIGGRPSSRNTNDVPRERRAGCLLLGFVRYERAPRFQSPEFPTHWIPAPIFLYEKKRGWNVVVSSGKERDRPVGCS